MLELAISYLSSRDDSEQSVDKYRRKDLFSNASNQLDDYQSMNKILH